VSVQKISKRQKLRILLFKNYNPYFLLPFSIRKFQIKIFLFKTTTHIPWSFSFLLSKITTHTYSFTNSCYPLLLLSTNHLPTLLIALCYLAFISLALSLHTISRLPPLSSADTPTCYVVTQLLSSSNNYKLRSLLSYLPTLRRYHNDRLRRNKTKPLEQ
jgi:hypothetical protein